MRISVLSAGWPVAWFLLWHATHAEAALQGGVVTENDPRGRLLVRKPDGTTDVIELDSATSVFGVDGYPLAVGDLRIGDAVAVVQERRGLAFVTTGIHLVRPASPHGGD